MAKSSSNPFSSFAAGGGGGGGWMNAKKTDSERKRDAAKAEEARKAARRRKPVADTKKKGGKKQTKINIKKTKRKRRDGFIESSDEESFNGYSEEEEEDEFIVDDDEEEEEEGRWGDDSEDEGGWDEDMEDSDDESDFGGKKKKKTKKNKKKGAPSRASRAANRRGNQKSTTWSNEDDEIEESPMPPKRIGGKKRAAATKKNKKVVDSPVSVDSDENMSDVDDIYAPDPEKCDTKMDELFDKSDSDATEIDAPDPPQPKKKKSKYFGSARDDGEEKKEEEEEEDEDENIMNGARNKGKNRAVLYDSDDSDVKVVGDKAEGGKKNDGDALDMSDDDLDDTPKISRRKDSSSAEFIDDEVAMEAAIRASLGEEGGHKRLKKKGKKNRKGSSSLEQIKSASPAKEKPIYKDDIEELKDSDDDDHQQEDDEVEVYEAVDQEEQTAAQVLAEANALSAKIVRVVTGWCDGGSSSESGNNMKGLILGDDGALNLGGGAVTDFKQGEGDDAWISDETMKEILPNVKLAEYQLLGVNWMALLNRTEFGNKIGKKGKGGGLNVNGILADEMGLGKTVQTIAFLAWLNHQRKTGVIDVDEEDVVESSTTQRRPHLIVVPASVLSNWMNEFEKFAPDMIVKKYHGSQAERADIQDEMESQHLRGGAPLDVVLTTFSYFSSDSNKGDRSFLRKFEFDYLVVDEGHTLKNPKGLRYQNLNKFKTSHRLLLTGTPVQNSPKELMSLLCFLMPLFDSKTKSSKRKKRGYESDDDGDNDGGERMLEYFVQLEGGSGDDAQAYRKLKQLFAPFVLRRKKDDVLGQILPPKTRQIDIVPMDNATRLAYDSILADHVKARNERAVGATTASSQQHLFTTLRKAANHPLLLRKRFKSDEEKDTLARLALDYKFFGNDASCTLQLVRDELEKFSDYEIHNAAEDMIYANPDGRRQHLEKYTLMESDLFCSPKFVRLRTLLPDLIGKGHRVLVFSQWTKILDLMTHLMDSLKLKYLRLDGQTQVSERQGMIDTFNKDDSYPVFLLSTRAGGMGLNLTAADVCILHDLDFNPFNDRQAEDRCHRIGQKKPVTIIKMVTEGTVDEDIYKMQERKESMNEAIMEKGGGKKKKSNDNEEMARMANAALERFIKKSPVRPTPSTSSTSPAQNVDSSHTLAPSLPAKAENDSLLKEEQSTEKNALTTASAPKKDGDAVPTLPKKMDEGSSTEEELSPMKSVATASGTSNNDTVAAAASKESKLRMAFKDDSDSDGDGDVDDEATVKQENKIKPIIEKKEVVPRAKLSLALDSDSDDDDDDMVAAFKARKEAEKCVAKNKSNSLSY